MDGRTAAMAALACGASLEAALQAWDDPDWHDRLFHALAVPVIVGACWGLGALLPAVGPRLGLLGGLALGAFILGSSGNLLPYISEETVLLNTASLWWLLGTPSSRWGMYLLGAGSAFTLFCAVSRREHGPWLKTVLYSWNMAAVSWIGYSQFSAGNLEFLLRAGRASPLWPAAFIAGMAFFNLMLHAGGLYCLVTAPLEGDAAGAKQRFTDNVGEHISGQQLRPGRALFFLSAQAAAFGYSFSRGWSWGPNIANATLTFVPHVLRLLDKKKR